MELITLEGYVAVILKPNREKYSLSMLRLLFYDLFHYNYKSIVKDYLDRRTLKSKPASVHVI